MKYWKGFALLLALTLALCLCGCGSDDQSGETGSSASNGEPASPGYPVEAGGVKLTEPPQTVVSLSPSLTEKLVDLGLDARLGGISDYCDTLSGADDLTICGTVQVPDIEAILSVQPALVLVEGKLPDDARQTLEQAGIPVAAFSHAESLDELMTLYDDLALLLEGQDGGAVISGAVKDVFNERLSTLNTLLSEYTETNGRKSALYLRLLDFTVATGDTLESELLETICLDNLAREQTGWIYPEEEAQSAEGRADFTALDVIFMDEDAVTIKDLEQNPFYQGLPATINDRYLYISSLALERQSLQMLDELEKMAAYAYPDAGLDVEKQSTSGADELSKA